MFHPFRVETTVEYRSSLPVSEFRSDTGPLVSPDRPNDSIMEIYDDSGRMTQKLYGRMIFDSFPHAIARIQPRAAEDGTVVSVRYVLPFLAVLWHRITQVICTICGLALLTGWLWVIRHGWGNVRPDIRPTLIMGSIVFVWAYIAVCLQLPLPLYPSPLTVWLEKVGKLDRLRKSTS
jgi:hypothetical protein